MPLPLLALIGPALKMGKKLLGKIKANKLLKQGKKPAADIPEGVEDTELARAAHSTKNAAAAAGDMYGGQMDNVTVSASRPSQPLPPWALPAGLGFGALILLVAVLKK